jgi:hypothetical protein
MSFALLMIRVLCLVGEKIVCVIRIKSDFFWLAIIAVARLRFVSPRYANKLLVKKVPLLILITQCTSVVVCIFNTYTGL